MQNTDRELMTRTQQTIEDGKIWFRRIRLRVLAVATGVALAAFALVGWASLPAWPVIGVAVAAVAVAVNTIGSRLAHSTCLGCGRDLAGLPAGTYGVACPDCGTINQRYGDHAGEQLAFIHDDDTEDADEQERHA
ncbi:MAG: hypothetical protein EA378_05615 [Phycisphaerales bacterium]|nr:MAG: hypothetical protein EA378_05615 [Phycisphaerales bacterium]